MSLLRQSRATAAFFSPMLHSVRASSRAAQPGSGIVVPKLNPVPTNAPPPETDPRHVSSPAAAKPGATTLGTQLVAYAYAAAFYPAAIRSTGVGFASGVGRAGGILAPIMIGALVALNLPLEQNFMAIGLAGLLRMIAVVLINHQLCASVTHSA